MSSASVAVVTAVSKPNVSDRVCRAIAERDRAGKRYAIVVAAEGAIPGGGRPFERDRGAPGAPARLGGIARWLEEEIAARTGRETRSLVLGHLQRGGSPTVMDRVLALRFGATAARLIAEGHRNVLVAARPPDLVPVPLAEAVGRMKAVPADGDLVRTAREMGIHFGDA